MTRTVNFRINSLRGLMKLLGDEVRAVHREQYGAELPADARLAIRYSSGGCGCGDINDIGIRFGNRHAPFSVQDVLLNAPRNEQESQVCPLARQIFRHLISIGGHENWRDDEGGHGLIVVSLHDGILIEFSHYEHYRGSRAHRFESAWVNSPDQAEMPAPRIHRKLDNDCSVCFYEQEFYVLSNFSSFTLQWHGHRFDTSEAAYHFEKFRDSAPDVAEAIRTAASAHEAFKIAAANRCRQRPDWDDVKLDVMRQILRAKADQHEYVLRKLLETGDRTLIEDSWRDGYWGIGEDGNGQNWLGRLWMEVRPSVRDDGEENARRAAA